MTVCPSCRAELAVRGPITAKRIKELGISPSRWLSCRWVEPAETRGLWVRGEACPRFDEQHPTAYAAALAKARTVADAARNEIVSVVSKLARKSEDEAR